MADVLRRLVGESVSIRNLRDILEALADAGQRDKDAHALTEYARVALRRQICHTVDKNGSIVIPSGAKDSNDKEVGQKIFDRVLIMLINEAADALFWNIASTKDIVV